MTLTLGTIVIAYLIGAIPFGFVVARLFGVSDIRSQGSGNIGATNVHRVLGFKASLWVLLLDMGKGALPVIIARTIDQEFMQRDLFLVVVAMAAILGHVFPVYLKFKGGKGVLTTLGAWLVLLPVATLSCVIVFVVVTALSRYVSLGSMAGAITLPTTVIIQKYFVHQSIHEVYLWLSCLVALLVILTHLKNIKRIAAGNENRFSFSSGTGKAGSHA